MNKVSSSISKPARRRGRTLFAVLFLVGVLAIGYLTSNVRVQLNALETATSDNVQWNLSQLEVEFLTFMLELEKAKSGPDGDLSDLRRRFDIFYSRARTVGTGVLGAIFANNSETAEHLAVIHAFADQAVPLIDGDDATLRAALPRLETSAQVARVDARAIALDGIRYFGAQRDQQRENVYTTLATIAVLTAVLLVALLFMVFILGLLNRQNRERALENEIRESRMSAIVTTSLDAIIAVDRDGIVLDFNGAAEEIFGYSREEAIGAPMADMIIPDHLRKAHDAGMAHYLKTGVQRVVGKGRVRLEGKRKSGEVFPVEFSIAKAKGEDSEIFISYLRDISKEVGAEEELTRARDAAIAGEKSKASFLAVMSHEMRTPLNGLLGTMELLGDTKLTGQQQRFLQIMAKSGGQLLTHVNDVLDISRLEAGKTDFNTSIFDIHAMIEDVVESQAALAISNHNELSSNRVGQQQVLVATDRARLHQVLLNLVGNAIKFTRNGAINIEAEKLPGGQMLELRVADTGIGIEDEQLGQIFDDFTTLDSSFGRRVDGTGLGLGIARRITEALGGEIGVESVIGEGSLFWIRMPILLPDEYVGLDASSAVRPERASQAKPANPRKILLVEDNQINREVARSFLESDNHTVIEAHDGKEGVALAEKDAFELILMDISMPEMDGLQATRAIRSGNGPNKDTHIFALTAHTQSEDVEGFIAAGMNDVLFKPMTRKDMRNALSNLDEHIIEAAADVPTNQPELVDIEIFNELKENFDAPKFRDLVEQLVAEVDDTMAKWEAMNGEFDLTELTATAHRLSGSTAIFGALRMQQQLRSIEQTAKVNVTSGLHEKVLVASEVWQETRAELL